MAKLSDNNKVKQMEDDVKSTASLSAEITVERESSISLQVDCDLPVGGAFKSNLPKNEFSSDDLSPEPGRFVQQPSRNSPGLYVESEDGNRRKLGENEFGAQSRSVHDADQKDEFASIKTVDDLGFSAWSQVPDLPSAEPADRSDMSSHNILTGVGDFAVSSQPDSHASAADIENDLNNDLDVENVGDELRDAYLECQAGNAHFVPLDKLCEIVNDGVIQRLLRNDDHTISDRDLAERMRQVRGPDGPGTTMRKIFAILILIGKVDGIMGFIDSDIRDIHLPLKMEWKTRKYSMWKRNDTVPTSTSTNFRNWLRKDFEAFENMQMSFLSPYFELNDGQVCFYKIDSSQIPLPYTEYIPMKRDGNSRVFKVKIHRAHHNFKPTKDFPEDNPYFAVKEIAASYQEMFREEVEVLEKFSGANKGHPHLVRLLLTYRYNDKYYLLFHWASGNLRDFWKLYPNPSISEERALWLIAQCRGIATGLYKIHSAHTWPKEPVENGLNGKDWGRHGDLKPENILWFAHQNQDKLVISDFGLTRYHSSHSRSRVPHHLLPGHSDTYRPPEFDLKKVVSQRYDIWTLGCLYLEFVSWYLRGNHATQTTFSQARLDDVDDHVFGKELREDRFFNLYIHEDGLHIASVKNAVKEWINGLHELPKCSAFCHDFLDMIENHLLVPEADDRSQCNVVCAELSNMSKRSSNPDYLIKGVPRAVKKVVTTPPRTIGKLRGQGHDTPTSFGSGETSVSATVMSGKDILESVRQGESSWASSVHMPPEPESFEARRSGHVLFLPVEVNGLRPVITNAGQERGEVRAVTPYMTARSHESHQSLKIPDVSSSSDTSRLGSRPNHTGASTVREVQRPSSLDDPFGVDKNPPTRHHDHNVRTNPPNRIQNSSATVIESRPRDRGIEGSLGFPAAREPVNNERTGNPIVHNAAMSYSATGERQPLLAGREPRKKRFKEYCISSLEKVIPCFRSCCT